MGQVLSAEEINNLQLEDYTSVGSSSPSKPIKLAKTFIKSIQSALTVTAIASISLSAPASPMENIDQAMKKIRNDLISSNYVQQLVELAPKKMQVIDLSTSLEVLQEARDKTGSNKFNSYIENIQLRIKTQAPASASINRNKTNLCSIKFDDQRILNETLQPGNVFVLYGSQHYNLSGDGLFLMKWGSKDESAKFIYAHEYAHCYYPSSEVAKIYENTLTKIDHQMSTLSRDAQSGWRSIRNALVTQMNESWADAHGIMNLPHAKRADFLTQLIQSRESAAYSYNHDITHNTTPVLNRIQNQISKIHDIKSIQAILLAEAQNSPTISTMLKDTLITSIALNSYDSRLKALANEINDAGIKLGSSSLSIDQNDLNRIHALATSIKTQDKNDSFKVVDAHMFSKRMDTFINEIERFQGSMMSNKFDAKPVSLSSLQQSQTQAITLNADALHHFKPQNTDTLTKKSKWNQQNYQIN